MLCIISNINKSNIKRFEKQTSSSAFSTFSGLPDNKLTPPHPPPPPKFHEDSLQAFQILETIYLNNPKRKWNLESFKAALSIYYGIRYDRGVNPVFNLLKILGIIKVRGIGRKTPKFIELDVDVFLSLYNSDAVKKKYKVVEKVVKAEKKGRQKEIEQELKALARAKVKKA